MSGQERIGAALFAETAAGAMPADEADIVAKRKQLVLDRVDQGLVVATRQIRAADRTVEQDIADMRELGGPVVVTTWPGA